MEHPPHRRGPLSEEARECAADHDRGFDDLLRWIDEVLIAEAGADWGGRRPTWIDAVGVLESRSDLVVPVFRAMALTHASELDVRGLLAVDREGFVAVAALAGLMVPALQ